MFIRRFAFVTIITTILLFSLSSCTQRLIDFTIISSKNVDMKIADDGKGKRVEGIDEVWMFISIPLGQPNLKEATDRAIESAGPGYDALIDGVVSSHFYWFIITGKIGYKVEGTPIKTSAVIAANENGEGIDLAQKNILYHSSKGISNEQAIQNIGITVVDHTSENKIQ